tara:strand:- start:2810 stop:2914 length:105 start_codon:yes stop_codon:yes gene_type:complete
MKTLISLTCLDAKNSKLFRLEKNHQSNPTSFLNA